ncbi:hypothetical protein BVX98_01470, partial [bacterium F11]
MRKNPLFSFAFLFIFGFIGLPSLLLGTISIDDCGHLSQPNAIYVLSKNVQSDGSCFKVTERGITLDLNQKTVTYDQIGGLSNPSFEMELPMGWDLSGAAGASRESTFSQPVVGRWYLRIPSDGENKQIVSEWTSLPPNTKGMAYFARENTFWKHWVMIKFEVEHETEGVIAAIYSQRNYRVSFMTRAQSARYRVRLTYIEERDTFPRWNSQTEYWIGEVIRSTMENGSSFLLDNINLIRTGTSGSTEPQWNTTLGSLTRDGNLEWRATSKGTLGDPNSWKPGTVYEYDKSVVQPTTPNGVSYTLARIRVPGSISGMEEPSWPGPENTADIRDGDLTWKIQPDTDVFLDLVDLRTYEVYGVHVEFYNNGGNPARFTLKNGFIEQGDGAGYRNHAVKVYGGDGVTVDNLIIHTRGVETSGFYTTYSKNVTVENSTVTTLNPITFNRHQLSAAIHASESSLITFKNNFVDSGEGWGGIFNSGANGLIQGNTVYTQSVITNHYGIVNYGEDTKTLRNVIVADPGQGLRIDGLRSSAEYNDITIKSVAPNWDIGRLSLDGIRVNDYWNGSA